MAIDTKTITRGAPVRALDIAGRQLPRRAVTGVVQGHEFPVIWVCHEEEWETAQAEEREPEAVPWPAEDVSMAEDDDNDVNETAHRIVREATED